MDRLSIHPTGTFEFALWCKLLRDRGYTGMQVARQLGKSEGYVNNLVRILERASLPILERWCHEQRQDSGMLHICATDWLMHVCILPHAEQDVLLAERVAKFARPPTPANGHAIVKSPPANDHATVKPTDAVDPPPLPASETESTG